MEGAAGAGVCLMSGFGCVLELALLAFAIWVWWKMAEKMGFEPIKSLYMLIPLFNLYVLFWLATNDWPIHAQLKKSGGGTPPPPIE